MKTSLFLLLLAGPAALAQTVPAPATSKAPTVLRPGHMRVQAHGGALNRPDKAPEYPGGPQALGAFFQENLKYPEAARVKSITGNVLLNATMGSDGRLSDFKVARSLSPECDAEALRVAALLPPWQPAIRLGVPLPVAVQLPVPFGNSALLKVVK